MKNEKIVKYPRTPHLPWSKGTTRDDRIIDSLDAFIGQQVIVTEKMDGENITMYRDFIHSRSSCYLSNRGDRDYIKGFYAKIKSSIPENWRICGEYLYSIHSIEYFHLKNYFQVFNISDGKKWLSWECVKNFCESIGLETVPIIYEGEFDSKKIDDAAIIYEMNNQQMYQSYGGHDEVEGYVVRVAREIPLDKFHLCTAKYVRENHVRTSEHWTSKKIVKNILLKDCPKIR